jgi:hypothetical protein
MCYIYKELLGSAGYILGLVGLVFGSSPIHKISMISCPRHGIHVWDISSFRSTIGGGYYGKHNEIGQCPGQFVKLLERHGIRPQYTMPYTPQQNGVAERRNQTLMDMVRSMMIILLYPNFYGCML